MAPRAAFPTPCTTGMQASSSSVSRCRFLPTYHGFLHQNNRVQGAAQRARRHRLPVGRRQPKPDHRGHAADVANHQHRLRMGRRGRKEQCAPCALWPCAASHRGACMLCPAAMHNAQFPPCSCGPHLAPDAVRHEAPPNAGEQLGKAEHCKWEGNHECMLDGSGSAQRPKRGERCHGCMLQGAGVRTHRPRGSRLPCRPSAR